MNKLNMAMRIAKEIDSERQKVVAIITDKKDRILSIGINSYKKTHPTQLLYAKKLCLDYKIYLHAEIAAIIKLDKKPYNIYIARVTPGNKVGLAKPCSICLEAILEAGIVNIHYTK